MEFFDEGSERRASFRQGGEVLLPHQQAFIPSNLAFGFGDFAVSLAQALFQGFNFGQERLPTGLHRLKLQKPLLCCALLGLQGFKAG